MNDNLDRQKIFWDFELKNFNSIYTGQKPKHKAWMDRVFRKDMYERYEFTIKHCDPIKGKTFLDVGCGTGIYSVELAKKGAKYVTGLDISPNMIQASKESARSNHVGNRCSFILSDLLEYDTKTNYDVTIGIGLFDYIENPLPVLRRMRDVTRDKIIISFPRLNTWRAPVRKIRLACKGCDVYIYRKNHLEKLLVSAGFSCSIIKVIGKLYCVVAFCYSENLSG